MRLYRIILCEPSRVHTLPSPLYFTVLVVTLCGFWWLVSKLDSGWFNAMASLLSILWVLAIAQLVGSKTRTVNSFEEARKVLDKWEGDIDMERYR